ncbi:MAG: MmgE/PrpD family protein [Solirubrobacteraceae bacterium]
MSENGLTGHPDHEVAYRMAFLDWLACAAAGADERAASAMRAAGDDLPAEVAFAATAGHVLDFDDTLSPGVVHVSAACAPAALVTAAHLGLSLRAALDAYAEGFEAMGAVAAASHPALYERGWHPTAVCGPIGAAIAAARLLGLSPSERTTAVAIAVLRAGGTQGAFGSDGKSIQVGLAAAAGVQAALVARAGASVDPRVVHGPVGFQAVVGASWPHPEPGAGWAHPKPGAPSPDLRVSAPPIAQPGDRAIDRNWIKLYPSCLGTHAPIETAVTAREAGFRLRGDQVDVRVHPVARRAAHLETVNDGLSAKFSIPYCVAFTLDHGPPGVRDFGAVDAGVAERSTMINVVVDPSLPEFGAVFAVGGDELAVVRCPKGAAERPVGPAEMARKVTELAGDRLTGVLVDLDAPAAGALDAAGLRLVTAAA